MVEMVVPIRVGCFSIQTHSSTFLVGSCDYSGSSHQLLGGFALKLSYFAVVSRESCC